MPLVLLCRDHRKGVGLPRGRNTYVFGLQIQFTILA